MSSSMPHKPSFPSAGENRWVCMSMNEVEDNASSTTERIWFGCNESADEVVAPWRDCVNDVASILCLRSPSENLIQIGRRQTIFRFKMLARNIGGEHFCCQRKKTESSIERDLTET